MTYSTVMPLRYTLMMVISTGLLALLPLPTEACMCMKPDLNREFATSDYAIIINVTGQVKTYTPIQLKDLSRKKAPSTTTTSTTTTAPSASSGRLYSSSTNTRSTFKFPKMSSQHQMPASLTNYPSMFLPRKNSNPPSIFHFPNRDDTHAFTFTSSQLSLPSYASNMYPSYSSQARGQVYPYAMLNNMRGQPSVASAAIAKRVDDERETEEDQETAIHVSSTQAPQVPAVQYEELERLFSFTLIDRVHTASGKVNQVLSSAILYTNPRTSCYPNLQANTKYLIWGKIDFMQRIFITSCNSLKYNSLDEEEMRIIDKFIQDKSNDRRSK